MTAAPAVGSFLAGDALAGVAYSSVTSRPLRVEEFDTRGYYRADPQVPSEPTGVDPAE